MSINETIQSEIATAEAVIAQAQARIEALNVLAADVATLIKFAGRVAERIKLLPNDAIASFKQSVLTLFDEACHRSENDLSGWEQWHENNGSRTNLENLGEPLLAEILDDGDVPEAPTQTQSHQNGNWGEIAKAELNGDQTWNGHTPTPSARMIGTGVLTAAETDLSVDTPHTQDQTAHSLESQEHRIQPNSQNNGLDPTIARYVTLLSQVQTPEQLQAIMSQRLPEGVDPQVIDEALPLEVRKKIRELARQITA